MARIIKDTIHANGIDIGIYSGGVLLAASQSSNVRTGMPVCSENSLRDIPILSLNSFMVFAVSITNLALRYDKYNITRLNTIRNA